MRNIHQEKRAHKINLTNHGESDKCECFGAPISLQCVLKARKSLDEKLQAIKKIKFTLTVFVASLSFVLFGLLLMGRGV